VELCYHQLCGIDYPLPAVQRGWLHVQTFHGAWDVARLQETIGPGLWLSAFTPEDPAVPGGTGDRVQVVRALAGFWPGTGFVEATAVGNAELEDHPRYLLRVFARNAPAAAALLGRLQDRYLLSTPSRSGVPRVALVNASYGSLEVQRVPLSTSQLVSREELDLYYGDGTAAWVDAWVGRLGSRRYGLTILSGAPGTGKTTLLRSVAAWLDATHAFYFMPASRFSGVDAGELVTFWVGENKLSKLRNVLVLEDAESILLRREGDNRERVAALLNLTDGVMGDALGLHIVCTLNSDLADLDPALLRPGRLLAQREFSPLSAVAAERLCRHLGRPRADPGGGMSLAEIFHPPDVATSPKAGSRRAPVGFNREN